MNSNHPKLLQLLYSLSNNSVPDLFNFLAPLNQNAIVSQADLTLNFIANVSKSQFQFHFRLTPFTSPSNAASPPGIARLDRITQKPGDNENRFGK
jgi:hypothetical protein